MKKIYNRIAVLSAAVSFLASCIYPFDAATEFTQGAHLLVVESDIIVGDYTYVKLSYVEPLGGNTHYDYMTASGTAWVEDDAGGRYDAVGSRVAPSFMLDTRSAPADRKYRLCVRVDEKDYSTDWMTPNPAPDLDGVSYSVDEETVSINISAHSDDGAQYFRWSYEENWKYHSEYVRQYGFDEIEGSVVLLEQPDLSTYWCYNDHSSTEIELCATTDLNTNALVNHDFLYIHRNDPRLMTRYRINVSVRTISAEAYRFLYTLKVNSDFVGSLFSPNPSDVRGNVHCEQDPDEYVVGYVDCCSPSVSKTLYINASGVYKKPKSTEYLFFPQPDEDQKMEDCYRVHWNGGFVPVVHGTQDGVSGVLCGAKRCIDCRISGGHLNQPADWIE